MNGEYRVLIHHIKDGYMLSRNVDIIPAIGDWVSIGSDNYEVKRRIWDYTDARTVRLVVEEPEQ